MNTIMLIICFAIAQSKDITNLSYPEVPQYIKEQAWDQGHKYADGMELEAYNRAQTDYFNGWCQAYIQLNLKTRSHEDN